MSHTLHASKQSTSVLPLNKPSQKEKIAKRCNKATVIGAFLNMYTLVGSISSRGAIVTGPYPICLVLCVEM